jgi:cell division initiation protein
MLMQDAENQSKYVKEGILDELKNQERDFKSMEKYRDNLIVQLKALVNNTNETVERFEKKFSKDSSFSQKVEEVHKQVLEAASNAKPDDLKVEISEVKANIKPLKVEKTEEAVPSVKSRDTTQTEPKVAEKKSDGKGEVVDAASEALAEVEKMKVRRAAALEEEKIRKSKETVTSVKEETIEKGSFFDQIN